MDKVIKLKELKSLIEHNGDFYTPEEFAEKMGVNGDFEIKLHDEDSNHWFPQTLVKLDSTEQ